MALPVVTFATARDGWHGRSFDLAFDTTQVGSRSVLRLKAPCSGECWIMGIQPTERGKQIKRPPGYYLNDLSLLILDDSAEVVASFLGGARRDVSCSVMMEAGLGPKGQDVHSDSLTWKWKTTCL